MIMDIQSLTTIGLSQLQAEAYALLIELGEIKPPQAATRLNISRTNAYKLLDKLSEMELAVKEDINNKVTYKAANPIALANLTAAYRAEAVVREEAVSKVIQELLTKYHKHFDQPSVQTFTGKNEVADAYRAQIKLGEDIFFIHTRADVPKMTFGVMHEIRTMPVQNGQKRKGILNTQDSPVNWESHKRSNLDITWINPMYYNAPVEWSVTDSSLLIVLYASEPHAILITDNVVAMAFKQIFDFLDKILKEMPDHQKNKMTD